MTTKRWSLRLLSLGVLTAGFLPQPSHAAPSPAHPVNDSVTVQMQQLAVRSKAGDLSATNGLARQMFLDAGIPDVLVSSFGFTDRVANAEAEYRKGAHGAVTDIAIVKAVNNMVATIGAPQWARTSVGEVRKLRMHMLVNNPQLFASQDGADGTGHYKALAETMTPLEGSYVATALPRLNASEAARKPPSDSP